MWSISSGINIDQQLPNHMLKISTFINADKLNTHRNFNWYVLKLSMTLGFLFQTKYFIPWYRIDILYKVLQYHGIELKDLNVYFYTFLNPSIIVNYIWKTKLLFKVKKNVFKSMLLPD